MEDFRQDYDEELAETSESKADAELKLDNAREDLEEFQQVYEKDFAQTMEDKVEEELNLDSARQALENFKQRRSPRSP